MLLRRKMLVDYSEKPFSWFMGRDRKSNITWKENWKKLARENVEFEPLDDFRIANGEEIICET
jgi:hypothetical protein